MCNLPPEVTCEVVTTGYSRGVETGRAIVPIVLPLETDRFEPMRTLLSCALIPFLLLGSVVLGADDSVGRPSKSSIPVRRAVLQEDTKKAGDAQPAPNGVTHPVPTFEARLASDGRLAGKISVLNPSTGIIGPVTDMVVSFLQSGDVKATVKPGVAGVFQAKLAPGFYTVIGSGASGYIASGVTVLPYEAPKANAKSVDAKPVSFARGTAGLGLHMLASPPRDLPKALEIVNAYIPANVRTAGGSSTVGSTPLRAAEVAQLEAELKGRPVDLPAPYATYLAEGNRLTGVISRIDPRTQNLLEFHERTTKVFLISGKAVIAEAWLAKNGRFVLEGVGPGDYSIVVAGAEGYAVHGVQVLRAENAVTKVEASAEVQLVSFAAARRQPSGIDSTVIDMSDVPNAVRQLVNSQPGSQQSSSSSPGGMNGTGGGGGAGGGGIGGGTGGGGLGALGAALGAAGLAAAIANGDSPSSP